MSNSWKATLSAWDQVLAAVEANQADFPLIEGLHVRLEASLEDLRILQARRAMLRAEMLRKTQDLRVLLSQGNELAARIRDCARSRYGIHSEKLAEFGIKPIRGRKPARDRPGPGCGDTEAPRNPTAP